jgi:ribonuclease P protein component
MRVKRGSDFLKIKNGGRRLSVGSITANWISAEEGGSSRLGVIASRKLGKGVVRTRARRLLREVFRLHQHELREPVSMVLVARPSIVGKSRQEVEKDLLAALRRGALLKASA